MADRHLSHRLAAKYGTGGRLGWQSALRGVRPFLSDKYDITKHPNYKYLSDFDKRNAFDVERYMSTRPAIVKPDEAFDIYEIDLSDEDAAAEE